MTTILFWNFFYSNRPLPRSKNSRFQNETKCKGLTGMDRKNCCSTYHAQFLCCDRYKIMKLCWLEDPNARPSFSELTMKLKKMENQHKVRFKQETSWTILSLPQLSSFKFFYLYQLQTQTGLQAGQPYRFCLQNVVVMLRLQSTTTSRHACVL